MRLRVGMEELEMTRRSRLAGSGAPASSLPGGIATAEGSRLLPRHRGSRLAAVSPRHIESCQLAATASTRRYQSAESRKLSIWSRCRRSRRLRHHSQSAKTTAETTHASQRLRVRPVMTGAASQITAPSSIAVTSVAINVTRMIREDTGPFSTSSTSGPWGKLLSWSECNVNWVTQFHGSAAKLSSRSAGHRV